MMMMTMKNYNSTKLFFGIELHISNPIPHFQSNSTLTNALLPFPFPSRDIPAENDEPMCIFLQRTRYLQFIVCSLL
jgi:hypothetical protein